MKSPRLWIETGLVVAVLGFFFGAKALSLAGYGVRVVAAPPASQIAASQWAYQVEGTARDKIERMVGELLLVQLCVDRANEVGYRFEWQGSALVDATRAGEGVERIKLADRWEVWANTAYGKPNCGYVYFPFVAAGLDAAQRATFEPLVERVRGEARVHVVSRSANWIDGYWRVDDVAAVADVIEQEAAEFIAAHEAARAAAQEPQAKVGQWSDEVVLEVMPYVEAWQVKQSLEGHMRASEQQLLTVGRVLVQAARAALAERRKGEAK